MEVSTEEKGQFWAYYRDLYPDAASDQPARGNSNRWRILPDVRLVLSRWIGHKDVGIFVRGFESEGDQEVCHRIGPALSHLALKLNAEEFYLRRFSPGKNLPVNPFSPGERALAASWIEAQTILYAKALRQHLRG